MDDFSEDHPLFFFFFFFPAGTNVGVDFPWPNLNPCQEITSLRHACWSIQALQKTKWWCKLEQAPEQRALKDAKTWPVMAWLTIFTYNTKFETFPNTKIVTSSWHPPPPPYSTSWKPEVEKAWVLCSCLESF